MKEKIEEEIKRKVERKNKKRNKYETSTNDLMEAVPTENIPKAPVIKEVTGNESENLFATHEDWTPNVAGHLEEHSYDLTGHNMVRGQDIWKFNPGEYRKKWLKGRYFFLVLLISQVNQLRNQD